ncbi:MAG: hypothetical protein P1V35_07575 [Planctomycetota bacterium]|nr:hypothetical protein [Planctomycetota bacterium]
MVQRIIRPLWLLVLVAFTLWCSSLIQACMDFATPDDGAGSLPTDSFDDQSLSIGGLIKDTMDPWALAIAALFALVVGRGKGAVTGIRFVFGGLEGERSPTHSDEQVRNLRTASSVLLAAGRGLLWGSLALNIYYLAQLPWFMESMGKEIVSWRQLRYVVGSIFAVLTFGPLFLFPLAKKAGRLADRSEAVASSNGSMVANALDILASLGLLLLLLIVPLTAWRARLIDAVGPPQSIHTTHWPVMEGVDPGVLLWSLVFVPMLAVLALLPNWGELRQRATWHQFGQLALISGILGVAVVFTQLWGNHMMAGGQADYPGLAREAGRSLAPLFVGVILAVGSWFLGRPQSRGHHSRNGAAG